MGFGFEKAGLVKVDMAVEYNDREATNAYKLNFPTQTFN